MREQRIIELVGNTVAAGVRPDFADLLKRIEADGGASTAPQMSASRSVAGRVIAYTAAGVAAAAALGTISFVGLSMGSAKSESFAADMECEAPMPGESVYEDFRDGTLDSSAAMEPSAPMVPSVDEAPAVSDEPVSDSDVSDSDVSDSDEVE